MPKLSLYTQKQSKTRDWRSELSQQGGSIQPIRLPRDVSAHNEAIHTNSVPKSANAPVSVRISSQVPKTQPTAVKVPKISMPSVPRAQGAIHATVPKTGHDTGKISSAVPHVPSPKVSVPSVKMPTVPAMPNAKIQSGSYPISPALFAWRENPQARELIRTRMLQLAQDYDNEPDPDERRIQLSLIDRYARINNDALFNPLSVSEAQRIIRNGGQDSWIDRQFSPALNDLVQSIGTGPGLASTFRNLGYVFGLPAVIASDWGTGQGSKGKKSITDALAERAWYAYAPDWIRQAIHLAPVSTIPDQVKSLSNFDANKLEDTMAEALQRITEETRDELGLGINQAGSEQRNVLRSRYLANSGLTKAQQAALLPYVALQRFADPLFNEFLPSSVGPVGIDKTYLRNWYNEHVLGSFPPEVINAAAQIGLIGNPARIAPISVPSQGEPPELQQEPQQQQQPQQQNQSQVFEPQKQDGFVIPPSKSEDRTEIDNGTNTIPILPPVDDVPVDDDIADTQMQNLVANVQKTKDAEAKARNDKQTLTTDLAKANKTIAGIQARLRLWKEWGVKVNVDDPDWKSLKNQAPKSELISKALKEIEDYEKQWDTLIQTRNNTAKKLAENQETIKNARKKAFDAAIKHRFAQLTGKTDNPKDDYQKLVNNYYDAYTDESAEKISRQRGEKLDKQNEIQAKIDRNTEKITQLNTEYTEKKKDYDKSYNDYMSAKYSPEQLEDVTKGAEILGGNGKTIIDRIHDLIYDKYGMREEFRDSRVLTTALMGIYYDHRLNTVVQAPAGRRYLTDTLRNTGASDGHTAEYNRADVIADGYTTDKNQNKLKYSDLLKSLNGGEALVSAAKNYRGYVVASDQYKREHQEPQKPAEVATLTTQNENLNNQLQELTNEIAGDNEEYTAAFYARKKKIDDATRDILKFERDYKNAPPLPDLPKPQFLLQQGLKIVGGSGGGGVKIRDVIGNAVGFGSIVAGGGILGLLNPLRNAARDVPPAGYIDLSYQDHAADPQNQPPLPLPAPNAPDSEFARQMERWIARQYAIRDPEPSMGQRLYDLFRRSGEARPSEDESIPKIDGGLVQLDSDNSSSQSIPSNYAAIGSDDDNRRAELAKKTLEQHHESRVERNNKLMGAQKIPDNSVRWIDDFLDGAEKTAKKVGTNIVNGYNWTRDSLNSLSDAVNDKIDHWRDHQRGHNEDLSTVGMELPNVQDYINLDNSGNSYHERLLNRDENEEEEDKKVEEIDTKRRKNDKKGKKRN